MTRLMTRATGTTLALLLAFGVSGCDSFLDVNEDPNNPESVRIDFSLPGMLIAFSHDVLGPTDQRYGNLLAPTGWGPEWLQQWSDNEDRHTYAQFQWYEVANLDTDGYWNASYANVMQEAVNIMNEAAETEQWAHHGIAKLIYAWNAALLTDAFGPIPLAEAFDTNNPNPAYQSQEEVYATVFQLIDEAIEEMQRQGAAAPTLGDLVWGGDMAMWVKLANSVKGRLHMRLVYAPGESATDHAQAALTALAAGIQNPAEAPTVEYAGGTGNRQPWYLYEDEEPGERSRSSKFFVDMLQANADPRLPIMAEPAQLQCPDGEYGREDCTLAATVIYRGNQSGGTAEPDSAISRIGAFFSADSADHVWFTYEDTKFLEAEARLITAGAGAAEAPYRTAIRANMERLGVGPADIDAYLAAKPPLGSAGDPLEAIITEKYVANFLRDEVWHDWRRTGYPEVPPVADRIIDGIPHRLRTPAAEMQFNSESLATTGISTGLDGMLTRVWWASGSPGS
jgi:hypothetical protein